MAELEKSDAPQAPEDTPAPAGAIVAAPKARQSLSKSRRELTEEELTQSGVRLMLMDELDRLDSEVARLNDFRERFHAADKKIASLEAKHRKQLAAEIVHSACLAIGVGILMLAPTLSNTTHAVIAGIVGIVLTAVGVIAKAIQG